MTVQKTHTKKAGNKKRATKKSQTKKASPKKVSNKGKAAPRKASTKKKVSVNKAPAKRPATKKTRAKKATNNKQSAGLKRKPEWLPRTLMAKSCGVSRIRFHKWVVKSVAKIGRQVYYSAEDVLNNRLDHKTLGPGSDLAKFDPGIAEYARQRIAGLETQVAELKALAG